MWTEELVKFSGVRIPDHIEKNVSCLFFALLMFMESDHKGFAHFSSVEWSAYFFESSNTRTYWCCHADITRKALALSCKHKRRFSPVFSSMVIKDEGWCATSIA